jgi:Transcriptional regulator containing PAS, AAA-type ATPase, and DNA-binding domains
MRPERAVVKKALVDAGGDKTRAAALLGCSRPTLYTWIYQLGLERLAGISQDRRVELDKRERKNAHPGDPGKLGFLADKSGTPDAQTLRLVPSSSATIEMPITATVKLPETLWKRVRKSAIDRDCTVSAFVADALEKALEAERDDKSDKKERSTHQ